MKVTVTLNLRNKDILIQIDVEAVKVAMIQAIYLRSLMAQLLYMFFVILIYNQIISRRLF